jgi:hypothetical protein
MPSLMSGDGQALGKYFFAVRCQFLALCAMKGAYEAIAPQLEKILDYSQGIPSILLSRN